MAAKSPLIKVLILFMVGIILPTGFLVYLGIVSIHSETRLLQKESEERVGNTGQAISDQAQAIIGGTLASLGHLNDQNAFSDYKATHHSVAMLLQVDAHNHLLYPVQEIRRFPVTPLRPLSPEIRQEQESAEYAEFRKRNFARAIEGYQSLIEDVDSPQWKAIFMTSVAGCLEKMEQFDAAESQYQEILSRYSRELDQGGQPIGLVIASQLGELQVKRGRNDLAAASYLGIYRDLLSNRWDLSWDDRQFFIRRLIKRLQPLLSRMGDNDQTRWQDLQAQNESLSRAAESAMEFMNQRWPSLQRTIQEHDREGKSFLLFTDPQAHHVVAYIPSYEPLSGALGSVLIVDMESAPLLSMLRESVDRLSTASNLAFRLELETGVLLGESGRTPEGKRWPIERMLAQTTPALRLAIAPVSDIPVERAAARRRQVFLGMVILAAMVVLIALYATWYAVSREIEVADMKARFVASMSHELKTPLSIIGFIGQKLKLGRYKSQDEIQDYYSMISEETERLKSLIDEVLDFSRLMDNRQPYRKVPVELAEMVRETANRFRHSLKEDHVRLNCSCDPPVLMANVDREAMSRVIINLLDNAVKYSPPERTHITLTLKQEDGAAVIQVADEGYGIPSEEKVLVFDRFYRGTSSSDHKHTKGVGLGLAIAQHIVAAHHGRIELQSTVGKGSIFSVVIPLKDVNG